MDWDILNRQAQVMLKNVGKLGAPNLPDDAWAERVNALHRAAEGLANYTEDRARMEAEMMEAMETE